MLTDTLITMLLPIFDGGYNEEVRLALNLNICIWRCNMAANMSNFIPAEVNPLMSNI